MKNYNNNTQNKTKLINSGTTVLVACESFGDKNCECGFCCNDG